MICNCGAEVIEALSAIDRSPLMLDFAPVDDGAWMLSWCCEGDHPKVAHPATTVGVRYAAHVCAA